MKLTELDPHWVGAGGEGISDGKGNPVPSRHGVGMTFNCPCGCVERCYVPFENPLDEGPKLESNHATWKRTGDTFETLTLKPSIQRADPNGCRWHGFITNGEASAA